MRVLVCGGRDYDGFERMQCVLGMLEPFPTLIIEGGAKGADRLARQWAVYWDVPVKTFEADWERYGKAAGAIRNTRMLVEGKPDLVVAFPGGRGTADMVRQAKAHGVKVNDCRGGLQGS